jgi:hypothetical protein
MTWRDLVLMDITAALASAGRENSISAYTARQWVTMGISVRRPLRR